MKRTLDIVASSALLLLLMPVHAYQAIIKPQYVDQIPHAVKGSVNKILSAKNDPV